MRDKNNNISKLEDLLREIEKQDYIKIKYEDLTETLEEAINLIQTLQKEKERLGSLYYDVNEVWYKNRDLIQKQQEEIEEKDKIIDEMARELCFDCNERVCQECCRECERDIDTACNCIIEYFEKKVEENE